MVDEGDWVVITVINQLADPTTVHWHGILQVLTPYSDGVAGTTQCEMSPGGSITYSFRATPHGTYW